MATRIPSMVSARLGVAPSFGSRTLAPAALLGVAGALLIATPALGWERARSERGAPLLIPGAALEWSLDPAGLPEGAQAAARRAVEVWTAAPCTALAARESPHATVRIARLAPEDWPHLESAAAYTVIESGDYSGAITAVRIELNGAFELVTGPFVPEGAVDLEGTLVHELGHALGLSHSRVRGAVMHAGARAGTPLPRHLAPDDVAAVCAVYPRTAPPAPVPDRKPTRPWLAGAVAASLVLLVLARRRG